MAALSGLVLGGCGSDEAAAPSSTSAGQPGVLDVVASFYPLQFVTEQVGGDRVAVANLTPPGAEPHDVELSPRDAATLHDADLVVYLSGFSPAVDTAVENVGGSQAFDVATPARLDLEGGEDDDGHDHGGADPHFWLDPTRLADVADAVAVRLAELAPEYAVDFTANAKALRAELEALDNEFATGLASCANTDIVTSHSAFGYLTQRYGLTQVGIAGLSPEEEPSAAKLADVTEFVREHGVSTIYYEMLVDPAIARTVADETGAQTAVLDPIEGLSDQSAGSDYFEVMRSNLAALRAGQHCA